LLVVSTDSNLSYIIGCYSNMSPLMRFSKRLASSIDA